MAALVYLMLALFWIGIAKIGLKYSWWMVYLGLMTLSVYAILRPPGELVLVQVPIVN